jgi:hypothetical protein
VILRSQDKKRAQGANKFPKSINEFFRPFEDIVEALGTAQETLEAGVQILAEDSASSVGEAMESRGEGETNLVEGRASGMGGRGPVPAFSSAPATPTFSRMVTRMLAFGTSVTSLLFFLGMMTLQHA